VTFYRSDVAFFVSAVTFYRSIMAFFSFGGAFSRSAIPFFVSAVTFYRSVMAFFSSDMTFYHSDRGIIKSCCARNVKKVSFVKLFLFSDCCI